MNGPGHMVSPRLWIQTPPGPARRVPAETVRSANLLETP
jgi:hypothetical protein